MKIPIKETYIEGNRIVFVSEAGQEFGLGFEGLAGDLRECEIIMFEKERITEDV